jgi:hypothetical protein
VRPLTSAHVFCSGVPQAAQRFELMRDPDLGATAFLIATADCSWLPAAPQGPMTPEPHFVIPAARSQEAEACCQMYGHAGSGHVCPYVVSCIPCELTAVLQAKSCQCPGTELLYRIFVPRKQSPRHLFAGTGLLMLQKHHAYVPKRANALLTASRSRADLHLGWADAPDLGANCNRHRSVARFTTQNTILLCIVRTFMTANRPLGRPTASSPTARRNCPSRYSPDPA